ncbi:GNAT family N-acetyltransferase [Agromyces aurantiacus]|uniref:GNAT family N-acetyltransferase n=1 Tax=Agromyces aurantiacus TaxID=165814 RepID=A0ABV9R7X8_9MICO|nr:GNAT family N-acetyltransferase [Agromyces aurantiacus]MBM7504838.1 GNAT superfamily N-acetyltransferase [Agromyces aurantiacus]
MSVTVRDVAENDFFGWLPLFDAYCAARGGRLDDTKALIVWSWIQDPRSALRAVLAIDDAGEPVGLVHFHPEPRTLDASIGLVVDDLYVVDAHRRNGVARQLLERLRELAVELHATRINWSTDPSDADGLRMSDEVARRSPAIPFELEL